MSRDLGEKSYRIISQEGYVDKIIVKRFEDESVEVSVVHKDGKPRFNLSIDGNHEASLYLEEEGGRRFSLPSGAIFDIVTALQVLDTTEGGWIDKDWKLFKQVGESDG